MTKLTQKWLRYLGIDKDWTVTVLVNEGPRKASDACAVTSWPSGYRHAQITYVPDLDQFESMNQVSLHETLHLYTADMRDTIFREVGDTPAGRRLFDEEEKLIDRITALLLHLKGES